MNASKDWMDRDHGEFKPEVVEICDLLNALDEPTRTEAIADIRAHIAKAVGDENTTTLDAPTFEDGPAWDAVFAMLNRVRPGWWEVMPNTAKARAITTLYPLAQARTLDEDATRKVVSDA